MATVTTRHQVLSDEQWERIEPLLPSNEGRKGHPFRDNRKIVEGIIYRSRTGVPWRDLPRDQFGPWQTVWKGHYLYARLGVWDRIHAALMAQADAAGDIDWTVSVDSTINRGVDGIWFEGTTRAIQRMLNDRASAFTASDRP